MESLSSLLDKIINQETKEFLDGDILVMGVDEIYLHIGRGEIPTDYAIVSFSDNEYERVDFKKYELPNEAVNIVFPDLDYSDYDKETLLSMFKDLDALVAFIKSHSSYRFICQCYEGKSRSAAVAAAIDESRKEGNGAKYFKDPKYTPNKFIYECLTVELSKWGIETLW